MAVAAAGYLPTAPSRKTPTGNRAARSESGSGTQTAEYARFQTVINTTGLVDLIVDPAAAKTREQLRSAATIAFGDEAIVDGYGKLGRGIKVSLRVPGMTQSTGFRHDAAEQAFSILDRLAEWYLKLER